MKRRVWNIKTGEMVIVEGIDATEYIKTGGWTGEEPAGVSEKPISKASKPVDVKAVDEEVIKKTRKKK